MQIDGGVCAGKRNRHGTAATGARGPRMTCCCLQQMSTIDWGDPGGLDIESGRLPFQKPFPLHLSPRRQYSLPRRARSQPVSKPEDHTNLGRWLLLRHASRTATSSCRLTKVVLSTYNYLGRNTNCCDRTGALRRGTTLKVQTPCDPPHDSVPSYTLAGKKEHRHGRRITVANTPWRPRIHEHATRRISPRVE